MQRVSYLNTCSFLFFKPFSWKVLLVILEQWTTKEGYDFVFRLESSITDLFIVIHGEGFGYM